MSKTRAASAHGPDDQHQTPAAHPAQGAPDLLRLEFEAAVERMARKFCVASGVEPEALAESAPAWRAYQEWSRGLLESLKSAGA